MFRVSHAFLSIHCSLVVTCRKRINLLALLCVMFYCVFVTFLCGVLGQGWHLIVSIPDLCLLTYFETMVYEISTDDNYCVGVLHYIVTHTSNAKCFRNVTLINIRGLAEIIVLVKGYGRHSHKQVLIKRE